MISATNQILSGTTIADLFEKRVAASADATAAWFHDGRRFVACSWQQLAAEVRSAAAMLHDLGLRPGDRVAHWSENRREWLVADLAMQRLGAVHVPLHAPLSAAQAIAQTRHSGAAALIVSRASMARQLADDDLPPLRLLYEGAAAGWRDWSGQLQRTPASRADQLPPAADVANGSSLATILYTSGTTGDPKGVMLTQSNLVFCCTVMAELFSESEFELRLCLLPLSHIFARTCDMYVWLSRGGQMGLARSRETVYEDAQSLAPTTINGVPLLFERLRSRLLAEEAAPDRAVIERWLGRRIQYCCAGGAPLAPDVYDFFEDCGLPVLQGYGLTETSPVIAASTRSRDRRGAVGPPIPGVEVRISEAGEVLTRGPHVMAGYYHNPAATREVMDGDWLRTGDLGRLDDGFLHITGRIKELIVTSGGKNVVPTHLEALLSRDPLIEQAMLVGDGAEYLAALIVPDWELLRSRASGAEQQQALVRQAIDRQLAELSKHEQVRRFLLLERPFSVESGELTAKLSLRRQVVAANRRQQIRELYAG